jgi:hypothetical protein
VLEVDRERRVRAGEDRDEVPLESLDGSFGFVCPLVVRGNALVVDVRCSKMQLQSFGSLVFEDLEPDVVPKVGETCVDVARP